MSERGKELFDKFIATRLAHPELRNAQIEAQVADLLEAAESEDIPWAEIVEEVGDVSDAIRSALLASFKEIT